MNDTPRTILEKLLGTDDETGISRSNLLDLSDRLSKGFGQVGALDPPLDPLQLTRLVSMSGSLRPLIDAMAVNVHGFGHFFEPVIDLDAADSFERVKAAMLLEREQKAEDEEDKNASIDEPTDDEVNERIEALRTQARREKAQLEAFFDNASRKFTFSRISRKVQVDKESTGYGVLEVRRDKRGRIARLSYAPSWTFRALPLGKPVVIDSRIRATDISYRNVKEEVKFRRYVQIYEGKTIYFKEFGDPRLMSSRTGNYYADEKEMNEKEKTVSVATEVLWFALDSSESEVYGQVRWSGCVPGVIGSREQAEVNLLFFRSKAIPPMVVLVSGGVLAKGARERLEKTIQGQIKGVENFHKILVLEARSPAPNPGAVGTPQEKVSIELKPLTEAIWKDALWQGYAETNRKEVGEAFRLPPLLRGDTGKLNRATAKIAREVAEQLVFAPERKDFEFDINRTLLADLAVKLWRFRLHAPESMDAESLVTFTEKLLEGVITVNEARRVIAKVLHVDLPALDGEWARVPLKPALAGFSEPHPEEPTEKVVIKLEDREMEELLDRTY